MMKPPDQGCAIHVRHDMTRPHFFSLPVTFLQPYIAGLALHGVLTAMSTIQKASICRLQRAGGEMRSHNMCCYGLKNVISFLLRGTCNFFSPQGDYLGDDVSGTRTCSLASPDQQVRAYGECR
jgi:hypothetical protein